ncbi:MAG: type II toxin-antitoxin system RelB/DinJ family antitoxin [Firmicutes bacterium]|nr:type II toxin-antitoxin system RelB/DinJ family antitoxin [Bacillota bacterium]
MEKVKENKVKLLSVRVDNNIERQVRFVLNELGLNISDAVNIYFRQILQNNGIPFEIKLKYNEETMKAIQDAKSGKNLLGPYKNFSEILNEVDKEIAKEEKK